MRLILSALAFLFRWTECFELSYCWFLKIEINLVFSSYMERMGATESREAIRMPLSQIQAVSRRDHVGSPLAFPWPKICNNRKSITTAFYTFLSACGTFCSCSCKLVTAVWLWKQQKLTRRAGTMPSLAMACIRRGAPVRLWSPAPQVEKKEPITITHGDGQANVPMTKFPCTPSPNLKKEINNTLKHQTVTFLKLNEVKLSRV